MSYTLTIPRQRDPIARATLLALLGGALWLGVTQPGVPAQAEQQAQIIIATPPLPLTPLPEPTGAPAEAFAAPTPPPPVAPTPEPQVIVQQVVVEVPVYVPDEPLHDLSQDPNAAPACAPGVGDAYCGLEVQQVDPAQGQPYEPMTEREQQYSRARTR